MLIRFGYDITVTCTQPVPMVTMLSSETARASDIRAPETLITTPEVPSTTYIDLFGNVCRRFVAPAGDLQLWSDSTIEDDGKLDDVDPSAAEVPVSELPDECLVYLTGSRYCETDELSQIAWDLFGQSPRGWARVQAISDFAHNRLAFNYGTASSTRTAMDAYQQKIGVCRDYAHLAIALCRCMNIPARYVNGYLGDIGVPIGSPDDFCAWMEVFIGGRWVTFDPRNNARRIGRVVVARGRDAADVPLLTSYGAHKLKSFRVWTYDVTGI